MASRGPDGAGFWEDKANGVALAHRRLAILDLSDRGEQPMASLDSRLHVVFNGEIYNHRELRAWCEKRGARYISGTDTETLLHLYEIEGKGFVDRLRGMFSFALWDGHDRSLLLARDPFGIKPLYYSNSGGTLHFASQVKALRAGGVEGEIDSAGTVGFWLWGHVPEPYTIYRNIRSLPPGSTLYVSPGEGPKVEQYCDIQSILAQPQISAAPVQDSILSALEDSVSHHLLSDVPVGGFLSSGIDSSTLCALVSRKGQEPLRTVTLGFSEYRGTENDETPLAAAIAERVGTRHETKWICRGQFQESLPHVLEAMDQPSVDGVNTYFVSQVTAQAGLKVALSGVGGDELFGGYPSFRQIPKLVKRLGWTNHTAGFGSAFRRLSAPLIRHFTSPKYAGVFEYGGSYGGAYLLRRALFMPWELPRFLDPDLVREGWAELHTLSELNSTALGLCNPHCRVSSLEFRWYLQSRLLRDADWAGMAHSLEIRTPLIDIELFKRLVPWMQSPKPLTKKDLGRAVEDELPSGVMERPKSGFSVPIRDWLLEAEGPAYRGRGLRGWAKFIGDHFGISVRG